MTATKKLAVYLNRRGISIASIVKGTGLPKQPLYVSLGSGRNRELRADEFLTVCAFIGVDPMQFCPEELQSEKD